VLEASVGFYANLPPPDPALLGALRRTSWLVPNDETPPAMNERRNGFLLFSAFRAKQKLKRGGYELNN
jgi:hypothetical protein